MITIAKCFMAAVAVSLLIYGLSGIDSTGRPIRGSLFGRRLQTTDYYFTIDKSVLGTANPDVSIGNPLRGLMTSPAWTGTQTPSTLPTSLEFYYFGLDEIMVGSNQFDWSVLDNVLKGAASRYKHVIWRVYCHYPGRSLGVPEYLLDQGIDIDDGSPVYDDVKLLTALEQFIKALGARYDGHKSLAFIQLGLLGYWGEWHTFPDKNLLTDDTKKKVLTWYKNAFKITKLQARDPSDAPAGGIGFHDDSFAYSTLGPYSWYFEPKLLESDNAEAWRKNVIGGETSPNLQSQIFESWYNPDSDRNKQDFMKCVTTTHATYMLHSEAFKNGGYTGTELNNAKFAHARMGYNYIVTKIAAISNLSSITSISVDVTLMQIGVAPFYYPLSLEISCQGSNMVVNGLETVLDDTYDVKTFRFDGIPTDNACLRNMKLQLKSSFTYEQRPIKFAQGTGTVTFSLPSPLATSKSILTLIDAASGAKIKEITNNTVINLATNQAVNILAEPPQAFIDGSVLFSVDGKVIRIENTPPFVSGAPLSPWRPTVGSHIIQVTPFNGKNLEGSAGESTIVTVQVIDSKLVPTKSPVLVVPPAVSVPVAPPTTAMERSTLTLIDAESGTKLEKIFDNMIINLAAHRTINILAEPPSSFGAGSVEFSINGEVTRVENNPPFTLGEPSSPWRPTAGNHTIKVTPFTESFRKGLAGLPTIVSVLVVDSRVALTLIDAHKNTAILPMTNDMKIDIAKYPLLNILVDIDDSLSVDRVEFFYDGNLLRVEYQAPFSFYGNDDNDYFGWLPTVGDHFVEVRVFRYNLLVTSVTIKFRTFR